MNFDFDTTVVGAGVIGLAIKTFVEHYGRTR